MSRHQDPKFETVKVDNVEVIKATDKAILVEDEREDEVWIPVSQLKETSVDRVGQKGAIFIPRWLAEDKDLDYLEDY